MDLRRLTAHMLKQNYDNQVITFEKGRVLRRTHKTIRSDVMAACDRLRSWGVRSGMRVGIWAANCYEWIVYDVALLELRAVSVAFTDDFATMSSDELIEKYSLSLLLLSTAEKLRKMGTRSHAIAFLDGENQEIAAIDRPVPEEDWEFESTGMVFSSGSSGRLKGLSLNRRGIEASVDAFTVAANPRRDDCLLLFLPISNFQQRLMYYSALWYGLDLIVTDPAHLFRALKDLHPTILIAPPMLYETIETRFCNLPVWKQRVAKMLAKLARSLSIPKVRQKMAQKIFKQVYESLGGQMRFMVTGMAPIKRSTLELFQLMQLPLFETYGMTEFGGISLNVPGANKLGSVGRPLPGVRVELAPDGEVIAVRDARIASTYFECSEGEAEQTFIGPDRVATGDIGMCDEDGYLYLIGRKREMIVTAGGTKLHPEIPETEIDACPDVARSVVVADADAAGLVAIILPKNPGDEAAKKRITLFVDEIGERKPSLAVRRIIFIDQPFSRENGFLRPNLKLDRKKIAQHFLEANPDANSKLARSA